MATRRTDWTAPKVEPRHQSLWQKAGSWCGGTRTLQQTESQRTRLERMKRKDEEARDKGDPSFHLDRA